jgi:hypothetical protein
MSENTINFDKNVLIISKEDFIKYESLVSKFCGIIINNINETLTKDNILYLTGDIDNLIIDDEIKVYIIEELSFNYKNKYELITLSQLPININNVGVYFNNLFDKDYYNSILSEHEFQILTESNKTTNAFRKGIYLTNVDTELKFNLLRCSSNLSGSTDNFRKTDKEIIDKLNKKAKELFDMPIEFNHVLAQVYENKIINNKEKKSRIKSHSDKTKDMPSQGLIAFCTFYSYNTDNINSLTKLRFKSKKDVDNDNFDVILYPNSVFIIPLSTNRLYTHEISPPILPVDKIPTRLGYVVRCSKTAAIYKDGKTFINNMPLEYPKEEDIIKLKEFYLKENMTSDVIVYDEFNFSLNNGDYLMPTL